MNDNTAIAINDALSTFAQAYEQGITGIVKASEIYVAAIDSDNGNRDKFKEHFADKIPTDAWSKFEAIGRKWMHPQLIMGGMQDRAKAAVVKRLPYELQEKVLNHERFPLLLADGETLKVSIQDATIEQVAQLVDGPRIRTEPAQKAYIEEVRTKRVVTATAEPMPYVIKDGYVYFKKATKLSKSELRRILSEI